MFRVPHDPIVVVWDVGLTERELEVCLEMMRAGGLASPESLLHAALYHFARHLELDIPIETFDLGRRRRRARAATGLGERSEPA